MIIGKLSDLMVAEIAECLHVVDGMDARGILLWPRHINIDNRHVLIVTHLLAFGDSFSEVCAMEAEHVPLSFG